MEEYLMELIIQEITNFDKLKKEYNYADVNDLIAHYVEEQVINSDAELREVIKSFKLRLGIVIDPDVFK
jgi:hypothetical protein